MLCNKCLLKLKYIFDEDPTDKALLLDKEASEMALKVQEAHSEKKML